MANSATALYAAASLLEIRVRRFRVIGQSTAAAYGTIKPNVKCIRGRKFIFAISALKDNCHCICQTVGFR
jgi:hypothetical protein